MTGLPILAGYLAGSVPFAFLLARRAGIDVRRSDVAGLGELYLLRANAGLASRGAITDLLEREVPGWQDEAVFYWPE